MQPDLVVLNAKVLTVDGDFTVAEAVGVKDGRISSVGTTDEHRALVGPRTEVHDLGGRTLIPGVHDGHMHLAMWAANRPELSTDLGGATSVADAVALVAARVKQTPAGGWIRGHGWYEARMTDLASTGRWPTRQEIDAVSGDHPVALIHFSEHAVWANTRALQLAGITKDTADPDGGTILREENGTPTGYLLESAGDLMLNVVPEPSEEESDAALAAAMQDLLDLGVTSVTDPMVSPKLARQYIRLATEGRLPVRVAMLLHWAGLGLPNNAAQVRRALEFAGVSTGLGDDRLRVAGAKMFADGIPPLRTSWTSRPYGDGCLGSLLTEGDTEEARYDELVDMIKLLHGSRLQVQVHATGDRACEAAVDGFIAATEADPWPDARHALIHANLLSAETAKRMAEHGFCVNTNALIKWNVADALPDCYQDERAGYSSPMRSLLDAGLHVADTSDAPVVDPDWRQALECLVLREARGSGEVSGPDERITREEALRAWTMEAAYQEHTEHLKGSIEVGKLADFVVLDEDLLSIDAHELHSMTVAMTFVDGVQVGGRR